MTIIIVGALFAMFTGFVVYYGEARELKRKLRGFPRVAIAELDENTAGKLVGTAHVLEQELEAPISGRRCLYWEVRVLNDKGRTVMHERTGVPFALRDATGHAIIDPAHAQVVLVEDHNSKSGTWKDATEAEDAFVRRHMHTAKGWVFNSELTYHEGVIEIGEQVAVLGSGVREPDPDGMPSSEYRGPPATRLRVSGSVEHRLVISDNLDVL